MNQNVRIAKELVKLAKSFISTNINASEGNGLDEKWLTDNGYTLLDASAQGVEYTDSIIESNNIKMFHWLIGHNGKASIAIYLEYKKRRVKLAMETAMLGSTSLDELQKKVNEKAKGVLGEFVSKL